ncbi:FGGY carbohydrate kinase domain-containing protein [Phlebotomus argentipes]|uniref:FGGY carbohydrate kinase domain-containing protein n=1 Tax=Phlebotomus argentipes TaxID=94469 RepID=UPI00289368AB|nr:FGGY carbohydrate kinase domain-containing protein [Phlebotomus argentipes]
MSESLFVGVDVGSGSARAGLFSASGHSLATFSAGIPTWSPLEDHYEQSSEEIWSAVRQCVKRVVEQRPPESIRGIGFTATCSLVALDSADKPLSVCLDGVDKRNIIMWMDHRAVQEANDINAQKHELLSFVGGRVSAEMECPKILWLKRNAPEDFWERVGKFIELPDFLTFKSTGNTSRSLCSVVCKWNYDGQKQCWDSQFLNSASLFDLNGRDFISLAGENVQSPGASVGNGLTAAAAKDLGLLEGTPVGTSVIDAYAGALALLGAETDQGIQLEEKIALICGTSTCHICVAPGMELVDGVWGPYKDVLFSGMYAHEAGQSATGKLLDDLLYSHPSFTKICQEINSRELKDVYEHLNVLLAKMSAQKSVPLHELTADLHVCPDFHGNRSPIADPTRRGMISGLTLNHEPTDLALLYLATVQALAYGTKQILVQFSRQFRAILICGGLSLNPVYVEAHADICQIPVFVPSEPESVLLGASILGARAAGLYPSLPEAAAKMGGKTQRIEPKKATISYHAKKFRVFEKLLKDQAEYRQIMTSQ